MAASRTIPLAFGVLLASTAGCSFLSKLGKPRVEGQTTPLTKSHGGQVVFAKATIPIETSSADGFVSRVELGDPLHARAYFKTSVGERAADIGKKCHIATYNIEATVAGSKWLYLDQAGASSRDKIDDWTSIRVDAPDNQSLVPSDEHVFPADRGRLGYRFAASLGPRLKVGDNELKIRVTQGCLNPPGFEEEAVGSVILRVANEEALASWRQRVGPTLPESSHPEGPSLVAMVRNSWKSGKDGELLHAAVLTPQWRIERHGATGVPIAREVRTAIITRNGDHCRARVGYVRAQFDGTGYGAPFLSWHLTASEPSPFPCRTTTE